MKPVAGEPNNNDARLKEEEEKVWPSRYYLASIPISHSFGSSFHYLRDTHNAIKWEKKRGFIIQRTQIKRGRMVRAVISANNEYVRNDFVRRKSPGFTSFIRPSIYYTITVPDYFFSPFLHRLTFSCRWKILGVSQWSPDHPQLRFSPDKHWWLLFQMASIVTAAPITVILSNSSQQLILQLLLLLRLLPRILLLQIYCSCGLYI